MGVKVSVSFPVPVAAVFDGAATAAVDDVAHVFLGDANETVPLEEGPLAGSAHVTGQGSNASQIVRSVVWATPYAVVQHEDESLTHDDGRRARWAELTMYERQQAYTEYIASKTGGNLGG